jgi:PilZ domain
MSSNRKPERRQAERFSIKRSVRYLVVSADPLEMLGHGKTVNMSSCGILFTTEQVLARGMTVQVEVDWPVKLRGTVPLQLFIVGSVVRSEKGKVSLAGLEIVRWKFRTTSTSIKRSPGRRQKHRR